MEFDKSKILTVVTADQAKVGQKGWFGILPKYIQEIIDSKREPSTLSNVDLDSPSPFTREGGYAWPLFYPVPEPTYAERQAQWVKENNVKKGTKVRFIKGFDDSEDGSECCEHEDAKGKEGTVVNITRTYIYVSLGKLGWTAPFTTLEVIKESTYRPFKNAEEFKPYRDEWFVTTFPDGRQSHFKVIDYNHIGIVSVGGYSTDSRAKLSFCTYAGMFKWVTRENGDPCGVREEA